MGGERRFYLPLTPPLFDWEAEHVNYCREDWEQISTDSHLGAHTFPGIHLVPRTLLRVSLPEAELDPWTLPLPRENILHAV